MSKAVLAENMTGEEAISHLETFFQELDEARDPHGKTGPDDDNFWVSGALQGPVVENARTAAKVLGRIASAEFNRLSQFLDRAEAVVDQIEQKMKADQ